MSDLRYGKRNVAKMIRQVDALRQLIRTEGTPDIQTAWDAVEEHIDFAYRALPAVQPDAREAARLLDDIVCGRGMFGLDPAQDLQWAMETAAAALALIDKPAHVNETPKREHDARDVLTPATKGEWQQIETAPKDRVIDLWSQEGGRYPDAVWGVCGDVEGWADANDHGSLGAGMFTHWRDRPAPPATKGGDA